MQVVHPLEIRFGVVVGRELDVAVTDGSNGLGRDAFAAGLAVDKGLLVHRKEPLHGEARLDRCARALARCNGHRMVLHGHQRVLFFEVCKDAFARFVAIHAVIRRARQLDACLLVQDVQLWQVVPLPHGKIIGIMGRA